MWEILHVLHYLLVRVSLPYHHHDHNNDDHQKNEGDTHTDDHTMTSPDLSSCLSSWCLRAPSRVCCHGNGTFPNCHHDGGRWLFAQDRCMSRGKKLNDFMTKFLLHSCTCISGLLQKSQSYHEACLVICYCKTTLQKIHHLEEEYPSSLVEVNGKWEWQR